MSTHTLVFPASFAQRRLWFVTQLEPRSPFYHIPVTLGLTGALNIPALERSLATIVARHEALRTTLVLVDGELMQVVREVSLELPVIQVRGSSPNERDTERKCLSRGEVTRPFDLEEGPLFRVRLFQMSSDEHVLQLVFHHAIFDGWSARVLFRELTECYRAYAAGDAPRLPELVIQYADYAVWQREWLKGEVLERQLAYWRTKLAGIPTLLELPTDRRRPPAQSHRGATRTRLVPMALLDGLRALGQGEGATLFMTLLAAFQVLLARWTGEHDIVVGTPIANRNRSEIENLIGFFVNSLALRTDLSGEPTFRELLGRVRETALGAYSHQDLPFERLVEEIQTERVRDRNPVFQVMFALQHAPSGSLRLPGVTIRRLPGRGGTSKFDLSLHASESTQGLRISLEFSSDLFEDGTIDLLLAQYHALLASAVVDPDRRIGALSLVSPDEQRGLFTLWNGAERSYGEDRSIHQWFELQAATRPSAVAIEYARAELTYRELEQRANRLAHALRRRGIGPEARVGVALDRSVNMVVALLAVLKTGGAYVPLDPGYPPERIALMLEDAGVSLLVTQSTSGLVPPPGVPCLQLDADRASIEREPEHPPAERTSLDQLAYVMYTSGSTGRPKAIGVPHRAVLRLVRNTDYVRVGPDDVVAQLSNVSFDAATFEIWAALLHGARLIIMPRDLPLAPTEFVDEVRRTGVTTMFLTTALFNQLAEGIPDAFVTVRDVLFGGEAADPRWVREVLRRGPPKRLLHVYGPTEVTTFATWHHVHEVPDAAVTVPIGQPIANTRACVLDRHLAPVPAGMPGELYLGGPGLARGYMGRPALTAERFVPDPFSTAPGARLYKTGDRVRWRSDGTLEFLGRFDEQVKIRGFRIEPGEVEAALAAHPAVRDCVVIAREDLPGGRALVGYVVPSMATQQSADLSDGDWSAELRGYLRERLPHYMVPSFFVRLQRLPLSPNGKVARRSLPPPKAAGSYSGGEFAPPRTPIERALAKIWCELLGVDRPGLADDFFDQGGHSLLAVRLFSEIERTFSRKLPLSTLFQASTLGQLAQVVARERPEQSEGALVALVPQGSRPPLFVAHNIDGDLLEYRELLRLLGPDQPAYGFEPPLTQEGRPLLSSIGQLAARYVGLMREAQPEGPYYICGYCWAGPLAFEIARQLDAAGQKVGLLALIDARCPGTGAARRLDVRVRRRGRRIWRVTTDNLERLFKLRLRALPGFLQQRLVNIVTHLVGVDAYRWSVRLRRPLLPAFRSVRGALDYAGRAYRPPVYSGRVTILYAQPPGTTFPADPSMGWDRVAARGVESYGIPGEHFDIMLRPNVEQLSSQLRACLDRAQRNRADGEMEGVGLSGQPPDQELVRERDS